MRSFLPGDFLLAREAADERDPSRTALTLLARACPDESADALERLTLGRRNARLLALHEQQFGSALEAWAECDECGEELEFALQTDRFPPPLDDASPLEHELEADGYAIRFRLLDSRDLHAASSCRDVPSARALLIERCVLEVRCGDAIVTARELPRGVIERLAARVEESDPQAETLVDLTCPACERVTQLAFDVASFVFAEVDMQARRLLREVDALARAYGWSEPEILSMSPRRRRDYMELLLQ